ncbi:MAG: mandelate racemase/muconate lactonizing enzyme family protein [Verrucomicrobia bacterium]|nr:mandelate racemase/muconate lactonizing enzyme family protein [Verrucomicrobiota bacterium]
MFPLVEPVSRRRYTVLKVQTKSGIVGYGETVVVHPEDLELAKQLVLGRAATAYEVLRQGLAAFPSLQAAVNMALLDILGQFSRAPIYQFLGGPTRNKARVLMPLSGDSDGALVASLRGAQATGIRAFVVPTPASTAPNHGQSFVSVVRERLEALRTAGGEEVDFVLDAAGTLSPGDAASLAAALERFHLLWFDEPCRLTSLTALRKIASETVTPLGLGRHIYRSGDFQDLLREDAIDVLRPDLAMNGLTQIRKMAALAESYYVAVAPFHAGGPIGTAAALHLAASLPNFFIQQIPIPVAEADRKMRSDLVSGWEERAQEGFAPLPAGSGLGVTINEPALEKYRLADA